MAGTTGLIGSFGAASAGAAVPDGGTSNAYGAQVTLLGGSIIGPTPEVTLGTNGQDSSLMQILPLDLSGLLTANTVNVQATSTDFGKADEQINAFAGTEGMKGVLGVSLLGTPPLLDAQAVNTQCTSNAAGSTGSTQIVGLSFGGNTPIDLPATIQPNTGLTAAQLGPLAGLVNVTLNKQIVHNRGDIVNGLPLQGTNIQVIGVQIQLLGALDTGVIINVSQTFCQATGDDIESVPNVTSVVPNVGPAAGGTNVTITGSGFVSNSQVEFGGRLATNVHVVSSTQITATSPSAAVQNANSTVPVTVSDAFGFGPGTSSAANDFTYEVVPQVTTIVPNAGPTIGGQSFTITGTNLGPDSVVAFGATQADSVDATNIVVNPAGTSLTGITAPHSPGLVNVAVADAGGLGVLPNSYTYVLAPVSVQSVVPNAGPTAGGTTVVITGVGFTLASSVTFGGTAATSFTVNSDTKITAVTPPHAAATVDTVVTSPGGTSPNVVQDHFTFEVAPVIASTNGIVPNEGPVGGGTDVTITGTNFGPDSTVSFGGNPATDVVVVSPTEITADSPASTLGGNGGGTVPVTVTDAGGTSNSQNFTYVPAPTIAVNGIVPDAGPTAGGTAVVITGTGFTTTGQTTVTFAGAQATGVSVVNATTIDAVSPPGVAGVANVVVNNGFGSSGPQPFTYLAPPVVGPNDIMPAFGPDSGGTPVTITGTGLTGITKVNFGGTCTSAGPSGGAPGTSLVGVSDSEATVVTPASAVDGPVVVCITAGGGTAPAAEEFTYESVPPHVSSISPSQGPVAGGQTVTITGSGFGPGDPNTSVSFGGALGTSVNVISQTQLTVVTPPSPIVGGDKSGQVTVNVIDSGGTSAGLTYTYVVAPLVLGISPTSGPPGGGETVIIKGTALCGATSVLFGTASATIQSNTTDCTQLNVTEPPGTGTVPVYVTTPGGTSRSPENFTYITPGYWEAASDGGIFTFGGAQFFGSVPGVLRPGQTLNSPIVAMADTPDHGGYWLFAADGGVFAFGDAPFFGSIPEVLKPGQVLNGPVVTAESTPDGSGYRMFAADGGVFDFGDAQYEGSLPAENIFPSSPVSGAVAYPFAAPPNPFLPAGLINAGYWLVTQAGGVYSFGNAPSNIGGAQGQIFGQVVAMATTPDGEGYFIFLQQGPVAALGDAQKGLPTVSPNAAIVFGQATSTGKGYWVFAANGSVYTEGDAPFEGSTATQGIAQLNKPITAAIAFGSD